MLELSSRAPLCVGARARSAEIGVMHTVCWVLASVDMRSVLYSNCHIRVDNVEALYSLSRPPSVRPVLRFPGYPGVGLVYSITNDVGLYDTGLNVNLCGMLGILDGDDIISDAARTISLRFNTYNGRRDGLFASVSITATFSLGEDCLQGQPKV